MPAPNIIEWSIGKDFLNQPSIYHYRRQYQILRDMFNLRCVICNSPSRVAADCWDKGREYLESENLLVWSNKYQDDVCPKCNTTRAEFEEDNIFTRYNTMIICVGMRAGKSVLAGAPFSIVLVEHGKQSYRKLLTFVIGFLIIFEFFIEFISHTSLPWFVHTLLWFPL